MSMLRRYWGARYDQWGHRPEQRPGYGVLVPVPGDLPVFLELALQVLSTQSHEQRIETLVIPDVLTPEVGRVVARHQESWAGELRVLPLPHPERVVLPRMRNPARNYGVQMLTGVANSRADYLVLHDADLFLMSSGLLEERVSLARREGLDVLGADPVWDGWFAERGLSLAATWEMTVRTDWLRSFPPSMHMGHDGELNGEKHTFDVTLRPQAVADPARRRVVQSDDIVHFNYVISTYRHFQRSRGTFADDRFRLLLIRLFIDMFAQEEFEYGVPELRELARGLDDADAPVTYPIADEQTREMYQDFRAKLGRILAGPWTGAAGEAALGAQLDAFDAHYA